MYFEHLPHFPPLFGNNVEIMVDDKRALVYLDVQRAVTCPSGSFDMNDPANKDKVGTAIVGKAACGDVIKLQVSCM